MNLNKEELGKETKEWKTGLAKTGTLAITAALMALVIALSGCGEKTSSNGGTTSSTDSTTTTSSSSSSVDTTETEEITTGSEVKTTDSSKENESTTSSKSETTTSIKPKNDNTTTKKSDSTTTKKPDSTTTGPKPTNPPTNPPTQTKTQVDKVADQLIKLYAKAGYNLSENQKGQVLTMIKDFSNIVNSRNLTEATMSNKQHQTLINVSYAVHSLNVVAGGGSTVELNTLINDSTMDKYYKDYQSKMLEMTTKTITAQDYANLSNSVGSYIDSNRGTYILSRIMIEDRSQWTSVVIDKVTGKTVPNNEVINMLSAYSVSPVAYIPSYNGSEEQVFQLGYANEIQGPVKVKATK